MKKGNYSQQVNTMKVYKEWQQVFSRYMEGCYEVTSLYSRRDQEDLWEEFEDVTGRLISAGHGIKNKGIRRSIDDAVDTWIVVAG